MECLYTVSKRVGVVSHWDLDGLVAAALLVYGARKNNQSWDLRLSTPSRLARSISELAFPGTVLVVADLNPGPNLSPERLREILAKAETSYWFDHHQWPQRHLEELRGLPFLRLVLDSSKTSSELVYEHIKRECGIRPLEVHSRLLEIAVADDKNQGDQELLEEARKWRIVLRSLDWPSKYRVVELFAEGVEWTSWLGEVYESSSRKYARLLADIGKKVFLYRTRCGPLIAVVEANEVLHPSDVYDAVREKVEADVYVISYGRGFSLRSRDDEVDVLRVARSLGGGGHPRAAGARLTEKMSPERLARLVEEKLC